MTDWLILVAFAVAWLAGWCSRWQWEKAREEPEEDTFERWAMIERLEQSRNRWAIIKRLAAVDRREHQRHWSHLQFDDKYDSPRWDADE